jgi:hypothetical protein
MKAVHYTLVLSSSVSRLRQDRSRHHHPSECRKQMIYLCLAGDGYHLPRFSEEHHVNGFAR